MSETVGVSLVVVLAVIGYSCLCRLVYLYGHMSGFRHGFEKGYAMGKQHGEQMAAIRSPETRAFAERSILDAIGKGILSRLDIGNAPIH